MSWCWVFRVSFLWSVLHLSFKEIQVVVYPGHFPFIKSLNMLISHFSDLLCGSLVIQMLHILFLHSIAIFFQTKLRIVLVLFSLSSESPSMFSKIAISPCNPSNFMLIYLVILVEMGLGIIELNFSFWDIVDSEVRNNKERTLYTF